MVHVLNLEYLKYLILMYNQIITSYKSHHKLKLFYTIENALYYGFSGLQFSWPDTSNNETYKLAYKLQNLANKYKASFIVNNNLDLAIALNSDALHIGQYDVSIEQALSRLSTNTKLGLTINTLEQLNTAENYPIDYYGIGPVFFSHTKPDKPIGLDQLKLFCLKTQRPVVAIGGITINNVNLIKQSGATGIAVIDTLYNSLTLENTVIKLLA